MRKFYPLQVNNIQEFKSRLLSWAAQFTHCCYFDSNHHQAHYTSFSSIVAVKAKQLLQCNTRGFEQLKTFYDTAHDWLFGYLSYDLKNELEALTSGNPDKLNFPLLQFFIPEYIFCIKEQTVEVGFISEEDISAVNKQLNDLLSAILSYKPGNTSFETSGKINLQAKLNKGEYLKHIDELKQEIKEGNIYEINFCQEFFADNIVIDPLRLFEKLNAISQAPFASFCRFDDKYVIGSSPERFLKKQGNKLISQPIKGTARRGKTSEEDEQLKQQLKANNKELNENIMIVDLVRNDLSRTAQRNSVKVEELCEVYTFKQVHQLISTISSTLDPAYHFIDAIKNAFPMGSMTGAPKVSALKLIEKHEVTKRGLYSGAIGYISPNGDFDFNVVIRSILYNSAAGYLSFMTGSAITNQCNAEDEYNECLLKARALIEVLNI